MRSHSRQHLRPILTRRLSLAEALGCKPKTPLATATSLPTPAPTPAQTATTHSSRGSAYSILTDPAGAVMARLHPQVASVERHQLLRAERVQFALEYMRSLRARHRAARSHSLGGDAGDNRRASRVEFPLIATTTSTTVTQRVSVSAPLRRESLI